MKEVVTFSKDKRAISIMIGYILLITGAVVMGALVYQWMKTYVPKDSLGCPDGVSIFISDSECIENQENYQLELSTKNNGRFDIGGYFIHATDSPGQDLATVDLSEGLVSGGGEVLQKAVIFDGWYNNGLRPGKKLPARFNMSDEIYSVEIIPVRFQEVDNKKRLVSCGNAKIVERVTCELAGGGECTDTCDSLGYMCGEQIICGETVNCGICNALQTCQDGVCINS